MGVHALLRRRHGTDDSHREEGRLYEGLVLLNQGGTDDGRSEYKPSVKTYIEGKGSSWHPWVRMDPWDGEKEEGTAQMYLTVRDPSIMETKSVEAEPSSNAEDGGV